MNAQANNASSYGTRPTAVSTSDELLTAAVVCGAGEPTHTPIIANQKYTNTTDGSQWTWLNGGWIQS